MESKSRRLQARNQFDPVAVVRDSRVHGVSNLLTKALSERRSKKKKVEALHLRDCPEVNRIQSEPTRAE